MAHGTPDWGLVGPKNITYGLDDLGEHAVRVGSPDIWDRRGDVVYITDFAEGLGLVQVLGTGIDTACNLETGHARHGAYAVGLAAGMGPPAYARLYLGMAFEDLSAVGLEFSFSLDASTGSLTCCVAWYSGGVYYEAKVEYDRQNSRLYYIDAAGVAQLLDASLVRHNCIYPEHTMKLVADMALLDYVRVMFDERAYDLRGEPVRAQPIGGSDRWYFEITHVGVPAANPTVYVDSLIITQNEPR